MYPQPSGNVETTKGFVESSIKGLKQGSNLQLVILDKDTNEFLGCSGIHNINSKTPELGIWLKKAAHGNGDRLEGTTLVKGFLKF